MTTTRNAALLALTAITVFAGSNTYAKSFDRQGITLSKEEQKYQYNLTPHPEQDRRQVIQTPLPLHDMLTSG